MLDAKKMMNLYPDIEFELPEEKKQEELEAATNSIKEAIAEAFATNEEAADATEEKVAEEEVREEEPSAEEIREEVAATEESEEIDFDEVSMAETKRIELDVQE